MTCIIVNELPITKDDEDEKNTFSFLSKRKYKDFSDFVHASCEKPLAESICRKLCEITHFDPVKGLYTKDRIRRVLEWRERKAKELGVSVAEVRKGVKKLQIKNQEETHT